jgi:hypothetical protein
MSTLERRKSPHINCTVSLLIISPARLGNTCAYNPTAGSGPHSLGVLWCAAKCTATEKVPLNLIEVILAQGSML